MKKETRVPLYITTTQSAWRSPNTGSRACRSFKQLQAIAVNKDVFLVELPGEIRVKKICLCQCGVAAEMIQMIEQAYCTSSVA